MSIAGATRRTPRARRRAGSRRSPRCSRSQAVTDDASLVFDFPSPKELRPPLIVLDDASVGYAEDVPVLSRLNLRIDPDDRTRFGRPQRQRQDDAGAAARRSAQADGWNGDRRRQAEGRLFRAASDRGARCRRDAAPAYGAAVAGGEARRGAQRSSAASASPATRPMLAGAPALRRRACAAVARAHHARRAAYPDSRRADQPSRRRCARGAGRGA